MVDVTHRLLGEQPQHFPLDTQKLMRPEFLDADTVADELPVGRLILAEFEGGMILKGHRAVCSFLSFGRSNVACRGQPSKFASLESPMA
jgi:hypothetical protein